MCTAAETVTLNQIKKINTVISAISDKIKWSHAQTKAYVKKRFLGNSEISTKDLSKSAACFFIEQLEALDLQEGTHG